MHIVCRYLHSLTGLGMAWWFRYDMTYENVSSVSILDSEQGQGCSGFVVFFFATFETLTDYYLGSYKI